MAARSEGVTLDKPTLLFLQDDVETIDFDLRRHHRLAAEVGFRTIVASFPTTRVSRGETLISDGFEIFASGEKRRVPRLSLRPRVILHRTPLFDGSVPLMAELEGANPDALLSFHPHWRVMCTKWVCELCFRAGEASGVRVPRPPTYLVEKQELRERLLSVGLSLPLIFKPSDSSVCVGILISTPDTFEAIVERAERSTWDRYVVQDLVQDLVLYRGRKLALRIYALVTSFRPLRFKLYRDGIVHLAAQEFDRNAGVDPLRDLTAMLIRRRRGIPIDDFTMSELLPELEALGYRVSDFWERLEALVANVMTCLGDYPPLQNDPARARRFYLAGMDLLMVPRGDEYDFLFLETNYISGLFNWGSYLDDKLAYLHRQWLSDLWDLAQAP